MTSRGLRNNNPGNIRRDGTRWQGEVESSQDPDFKQFETMAWGYRAMFRCLNTYYRRYGLDTLRKMITRWAPPTENDTESYIRAVSEWSGVPQNGRITPTNRDVMIPIVEAMSRVENGVAAQRPQVEAGWRLFIDGVSGTRTL